MSTPSTSLDDAGEPRSVDDNRRQLDAVQNAMQLLKSCGRQDLCELLSRETAELSSSSWKIDGDGSVSSSVAAKSSTSLTDTDSFALEYYEVVRFVDNAADRHKPELAALLFPLFANMYLGLLSNDRNQLKAHDFMVQFGDEQNGIWRNDVAELRKVTDTNEANVNETTRIIRSSKYAMRMSRSTLGVLKPFLTSHPLIERIVREHLHIEPADGPPRSDVCVASVSGSLMGEAQRSLNKSKMLYGVLKEDFASTSRPSGGAEEILSKKKRAQKLREAKESKKSKDPNVPPLSRVPLPDWSEAMRAEKRQAQKDYSKRVKLSNTHLPSACMYTMLNADGGMSACELSEDTSMLAVGYGNSSVQVWSATNEPLKCLKPMSELDQLEADAVDIHERILDVQTGQQHQTLYGHHGSVYGASFSPDRRLLLTCSEDATARLWSTQLWKNVVVYRAAGSFPIWDIQFCSRGYYFATAHADRTAAAWCTDRMQPIRTFTDHLSDVSCIEFHPNCNYVATGSDDRCVRVFDMLNGSCVRFLTGHRANITRLRFSNDGKLLVAAGADGRLLIWDVGQSRLLASLALSDQRLPIYSLAFTKDNTVLAAGGCERVHFLSMDHLATSTDVDDVRTMLSSVQLTSYATKSTPVLSMRFTSKNLLLAVGSFDQK